MCAEDRLPLLVNCKSNLYDGLYLDVLHAYLYTTDEMNCIHSAWKLGVIMSGVLKLSFLNMFPVYLAYIQTCCAACKTRLHFKAR